MPKSGGFMLPGQVLTCAYIRVVRLYESRRRPNVDGVPETLQQLLRRRLGEMGRARGRDEPLPLLEAFNAVREPLVTYELVRRVEKDGHTNIGDKAVATIATMLGVDENDVRRAAGQRPALEPFHLPRRADKLVESERDAVLGIIDAILDAGERGEARNLRQLRDAASRQRDGDVPKRGTP